MASTWTDEEKQAVVDQYLAAEPTASNSMEIVAEIAKEIGKTANGVRMILTKAKNADGSSVYIIKEAATKSTASKTATASGDKAPRVSKEGAQQALTAAIEAAGGEADGEIISKLTGKAAQYFAGVIATITAATDD